MRTIGLFDAKTHLSGLVEALAEGREDLVVISRRGKPAARLTAISRSSAAKRIGVARGRVRVPDDIDRPNAAVAALFGAPQPRP
jgi:antitoxin (DNA-binding transcriptional repressor) of toxin-antitoxin stability system